MRGRPIAGLGVVPGITDIFIVTDRASIARAGRGDGGGGFVRRIAVIVRRRRIPPVAVGLLVAAPWINRRDRCCSLASVRVPPEGIASTHSQIYSCVGASAVRRFPVITEAA